MEKFWWSGETEADVGDAYSQTMNLIESTLNRLLANISFGPKAEQWAFIAIIRKEEGLGLGEVARKSSRGKVLEFRLKLSHAEFLSADPTRRIQLVFSALHRSVTLMEKLGVSTDERCTLDQVLSQAEKDLRPVPLVEIPGSSDLTATTAPEDAIQSATASSSGMIKLYKEDGDGRIRSYWEAWKADNEVIIHSGVIGTRGSTREINLSFAQDASSIIRRESAQPRAEGYHEIENDQMFQIVIQFQIAGMGMTNDLDKRYKIEHGMNQCLGWTGLGFCDGGDIGSGTMNVFCFVVDSAKAIPIIKTELQSLRVLEEATIALISDEHEQVVWPIGFEGKFAM